MEGSILDDNYRRNHITFGLGTIGRDMIYALISMYLIFYMTDILELSTGTLWWVTGIILFARIFDALNDPVMGIIVDNTKHRWGKFKPWIARGALLSGVLTVLLFTDFGLSGPAFILLFFFLYIAWGLTYTANDIAYWSMLPALTLDQKKREKMGAFARICANIGLFSVVAGIVPITNALGDLMGSLKNGYFAFVIICVLIMWIGQSITLFGVKEPREVFNRGEATPLKELFSVIVKNDQLLYVALAMSVFMIGYVTTTSFGLYYFKYAYGNEDMYGIFALVLGVSQLGALAFFPLFSKFFTRRQLYTGGTVLVVIGYILFFLAPMNMLYIGSAGILLFLGQAFIQLLILMFLADTIEYGQWKLGRRNESITFSLQPLINKIGGAVGSGVVGAVVILSGIAEAKGPADVTSEGLWMMKTAMLIFPLIMIVVSYLIYRFKYKIDKEMYEKIIGDLKERGELNL